jgi:hypothetical protein
MCLYFLGELGFEDGVLSIFLVFFIGCVERKGGGKAYQNRFWGLGKMLKCCGRL